MRKRQAAKRDVLMDPIYKSKLVTKSLSAPFCSTSKCSSEILFASLTILIKNSNSLLIKITNLYNNYIMKNRYSDINVF